MLFIAQMFNNLGWIPELVLVHNAFLRTGDILCPRRHAIQMLPLWVNDYQLEASHKHSQLLTVQFYNWPIYQLYFTNWMGDK